MSFRPVFIAVVIAFGLIVGAFLVNRARPRVETDQPTAAFVRASGKCAECHIRQQYSIVHEYELSVHAKKGINCLYANGSAQWVDYKAFDKSPWNTIPPGIGVDINSTSSTYNLPVLDEEIRAGHTDPTGLWVDLDRQSR